MGKYDQYEPKIREVMELLDQQGASEPPPEPLPEDPEELAKEKEAGEEAARRLLEKAEEEAGQDSVGVEYNKMMQFYDALLEDYQRREAEENAGEGE